MPDKVQLADPKNFKMIGKPLRRVDSSDKIRGPKQFGIDMRVPGCCCCIAPG
jgi:isoquinoline 1-oxidoreductase subunit beta